MTKFFTIILLFISVSYAIMNSNNDGMGRGYSDTGAAGTDETVYLTKASRLSSLVNSKLNQTKIQPSFEMSYTSNSTSPTQAASVVSQIGLLNDLNLAQFDLSNLSNSDELNFILNHSLELLIAQGIQAALQIGTQYNISAFFSIAQQDGNKTNYEADISLSLAGGFVVNASLVTVYQPQNDSWETAYFDLDFVDGNNTKFEIHWTTDSKAFALIITQLDQVLEKVFPTGDSSINELNLTDFIDTNTYTVVDASTLATDPILNVLMQMGEDFVAEQEMKTGISMNSGFAESLVQSIDEQNQFFYTYGIDVANLMGSNLKLNYEVYRDEKTGGIEVENFAFNLVKMG